MGRGERYCMHCANWYAPTHADQCNLPGKIILENSLEVGFETRRIESIIYGHPSELNRDNNCPHYKNIGITRRILRKVLWGVPLRSTMETKVLQQPKSGTGLL